MNSRILFGSSLTRLAYVGSFRAFFKQKLYVKPVIDVTYHVNNYLRFVFKVPITDAKRLQFNILTLCDSFRLHINIFNTLNLRDKFMKQSYEYKIFLTVDLVT